MILFFTIFVILCSIPSFIWSDDIWFLLPTDGQPITGDLTIKIHPPYEKVPVFLWMEEERTDRMVWSATVLPEYDYTIIVDTTRLNPGKHEINASYYLYGEEFEGDIDIEINSP